jgi:hypothetical protein
VLARRLIIPSQRYIENHYSPALAEHLSSLIPPPIDPSHSSDTLNTLASSVDTIRGKQISNAYVKGSSSRSNPEGGINFLNNMPTLNMNMDMRKWNWGYLTFGKGQPPKNAGERDVKEKKGDEVPLPEDPPHPETAKQLEVEVNTEALEDAISSDSMSILSKDRNARVDNDAPSLPENSDPDGSTNIEDVPRELVLESSVSTSSSLAGLFNEPTEETPPPSPPPLLEFTMTKVHIAPYQDPTATGRVTIHYLIVSFSSLLFFDGA